VHGQAEVSLKKGWIISQLLNKMKIISLLASFLKNGMNLETSATTTFLALLFDNYAASSGC